MAVASFVARDVSPEEFARLCAWERADARVRGGGGRSSRRVTIVAARGGELVGCAVLVVHERDASPTGWGYLEELFVEAPLRHHGVGSVMLEEVEARAYALGVREVWTRTAGYEAPGFYARQGYARCFRVPSYFRSGHALVGLRKPLPAGGRRPGPARRARVELALVERPLTPAEQAHLARGFVAHGEEHDNPETTAARVGFVALAGGEFVACVSGLGYRDEAGFLPWFFLTNLFVAPAHRGLGLGRELASLIERRALELGMSRAWTQLTSLWELGFLRARGYSPRAVFERWGPREVGLVTVTASLDGA